MSLALLLATRRDHSALAWQACLGVGVDIVVAALITHAIPGAAPGVAMMLLFNVGAAALLVPLPLAMSVAAAAASAVRSEEHTSELQSLMRISYAVFCLKKKKQ